MIIDDGVEYIARAYPSIEQGHAAIADLMNVAKQGSYSWPRYEIRCAD